MKRIQAFIIVLVFGIPLSFAQEKGFQVFIFGGVNHTFEYGSADDYIQGENDFPITPAHTPWDLGASFAYFFSGRVGIELDGRLILSSHVTAKDPSDQDTVNFNTSRHFALTLNLVFQLLSGRFRPYFVAGGGLDCIQAKDQTLTTKYGYETVIQAPPSKELTDAVMNLGGGIRYFFSKNFGLRLDGRYILIFDKPSKVQSVNFVGGIFLKF